MFILFECVGNVVCANCSDQKHALQKFGYDNQVRCCNTCDKFINMQQMNSNELSNLSPKALKEYITAYNLPFKTAIEKSDLVRIIFNTRPISNESENHYRNNRRKQPSSSNTSSTSNNDNSSFSFSNIMQELFTPPSEPSAHTQQRQQQEESQKRYQEQTRAQQQRHQEQMRIHQEQVRLQQQQEQQQQREEHLRRMREQQQQQQQRQSTPQRNTTTALNNTNNRQSSNQSPSPSNDNLLSLHDLVKAKIDPASLSVRTLKSVLKANFVEQSHVIEKSELVKLVVRLADQHKADMETTKKSDEGDGGGGGNEDNLCRICFDNQQNCVFLDCGHMVTCMECAKKLIESRNECPICREPILKLVHVFRS